MFFSVLYSRFAPVCVVLFGFWLLDEVQGTSEIKHKVTRVVLVGATGDLARKYLWQGLLNLYLEKNSQENELKIYAGARMDPESGLKHIRDTMKTSLKCTGDQNHRDACERERADFVEQVTYHKLESEDDYKLFCEGLLKEGDEMKKEQGRIFYLSVPPSAYGAIGRSINLHCRPSNNKNSFLRVVFEKPFGKDLSTAAKLADTLAQYFREDEIYRIDHYLGKIGVEQILKFRYKKQVQFEALWNKDHIDRIEIALKEKDDCKGRTSFYNQYGVIRDVMQNHMTELLAMVAMETPINISNASEVHSKKIRILKDIRPPHHYSTVIGQYKDYIKHIREETGATTYSSGQSTQTFAATMIYINNARWYGVPFIFISGKQLEERAAYVRVVFKNNEYKMKSTKIGDCNMNQLIFHIQGGILGTPALVMSNNLPVISKFMDWKSLTTKPDTLYSCAGNEFNIFIPPISQDAYSTLIKGVYSGHLDLFVGTEDLLASWEIWTPLLQSLEYVAPRQYDGNRLEVLDFTIKGQRLEFTTPAIDGECNELENNVCTKSSSIKHHYKPTTFRNQSLVLGSLQSVFQSLAANIRKHALDAVISQGVFHLALSGGSSPLYLFEQLAFFSPEFPWHAVHIWLADERCVQITNKTSNFHSIHQNLLQFVPVPPLNIHPMPVSLGGRLCHPSDHGPKHYEGEMRNLLAEGKLDYVVLGVGSDGHTASLFPNSPLLMASKNWVTFSESKEINPKGERMTLSLEFLNQAKVVAVLIVGEKKAGIVQQLSHGETDVTTMPITGIQPVDGELTWYIDEKAIRKE